MSHTIIVILGGLVLLALTFAFAGRRGLALHRAMPVFAVLWACAAGINLWVGVAHAGYSVAEELPIFLVVFAVPTAIGWLIARRGP